MTDTSQQHTYARPWPALWALCLGFFMILVDTTIVAVANPAILEAFSADINSVVWVTSATSWRMRCRCSSPGASATGTVRRSCI